MKKIKSFFLFSCDTKELSIGKRVVYELVNAVLILSSAIVTGLSSLLLAYGIYPNDIFFSYFDHPFIVCMNLLLPVLLALFLYGLFGRAWISQLISGFIVIGLSTANFYLIKFRDDPLMFADVMYVREAAQMNRVYDMTPGSRIVMCWLALAVTCVILFFFAKKKVTPKIRIPVAVIAAAVLFVPLKNLYFDVDTYNKARNIDCINRWSSTQVYISKGFVYPFVHSISEAFPKAPEGYSKSAAKQLLSDYSDSDIPEDKKVNIIAIMLEAYNDLERLGIDGIPENVYSQYHELLEECYHGTLVTNIFAGGTIDSERAFLTGYSTLGNFRKDTNSYVRYLTGQNYYADGSHPCFRWFYNRLNVNEYLGFKNYYFFEDYYSTLTESISPDSVVFPEIYRFYNDEKNEDGNYFGFHVTYQGHGPYADSYYDWIIDPLYENPAISEQSSFIMNNYLGSVADSTRQLSDLIDKLREDDTPVVVVFFGDHKPWLGDGNSVYNELLVNLDLSSEQGFMNYYSTEYAFWANDSAKRVLGNDFVGVGPTISPCFLMNELFRQCSYDGNAYMKFTDYVRSVLPVINKNGFIDAQGNFYTSESELSEEQKTVLKNFRIVEKYVLENFSE